MKAQTLIFLCVGSLLMTACSEVGFQSSKDATLAQSSVFGGPDGTANGQINQPGGTEGEVPGRDTNSQYLEALSDLERACARGDSRQCHELRVGRHGGSRLQPVQHGD